MYYGKEVYFAFNIILLQRSQVQISHTREEGSGFLDFDQLKGNWAIFRTGNYPFTNIFHTARQECNRDIRTPHRDGVGDSLLTADCLLVVNKVAIGVMLNDISRWIKPAPLV